MQNYSDNTLQVIPHQSSDQTEATKGVGVEKVWYKKWWVWAVVGIGIIVAFAVFTPPFGCCEGGQNSSTGER